VREVPLLLSALLAAAPLSAQQSPLGATCIDASSSASDLCVRAAEATRAIVARTAVALSGGNPVPGTASTLGMRIGSQPRLTISARVTAIPVKLPGLAAGEDVPAIDFTGAAIALDLGVGIFSGLTLGPTVGGFGSVDLLASVGRIGLPARDGFRGAVTSWGAGARVGLLRESFTAPGISISALYRRMGVYGFGDLALANQGAWFRLEDASDWSLRVAAGKRLLGLGLTAGVGRDLCSTSARVRVRDSGAVTGRFDLQDPDLRVSRTMLYTNAAFTMIILHAVAELGWQSGGSVSGIPTSGRLAQSTLYGSLALRISL